MSAALVEDGSPVGNALSKTAHELVSRWIWPALQQCRDLFVVSSIVISVENAGCVEFGKAVISLLASNLPKHTAFLLLAAHSPWKRNASY
ncbi:hypothetical protein AVEN_120441-1 [Araneus ventricosus]|uniref:Uncharacterized protein n=1 Tax=Araneus ventricosus TaxID=182803 RepID=A0A4Y2VPR5_ARAVE|nr:hypothetical protein AVEN_120441-1 [Araneus ventricosus]